MSSEADDSAEPDLRMLETAATESRAVRRRRESRREEWTEHIKLAGLLDNYLDPSCTSWTSLENKPLSMLSGLFQKRRGVRSGLPDVLVLFRQATGIIVVFIELKSRRGVASKVQKQIRLKMLPAGAVWWMARSARVVMVALHLSGVVFRRKWEPPQLQPWEGPFADPTQRLPQHPKVAAERREAKRRSRAMTSPHRAPKSGSEMLWILVARGEALPCAGAHGRYAARCALRCGRCAVGRAVRTIVHEDGTLESAGSNPSCQLGGAEAQPA
jgi:hypothetical protein